MEENSMAPITLVVNGHTYIARPPFTVRRLRQFVESFDRQDGTGCWIWNKALDSFVKRYGATSWKGKAMGAHRLSYMMFIGDIPDGWQVHHKCYNPKCVNPEHLQAVDIRTHNEIEAKHKHKEVCKNGHPQDTKNVYLYEGSDKRRCRACVREWATAHRVLRGRRLTCRKGHPYDVDNTYMFRGTRYCRACHNNNTKGYYQQRKEKLAATCVASQTVL